ncbi:hypothetical protein MTO96_036479 [Rhipicephalus appendiculatus]
MGSAFRKEVPDPRTHLTERERSVVTHTWKRFQGAHKDYGELIFLTMFSRHPDYLQLFRHFKDKSIDELPADAQFRAHACAVAYQLSSMVDSVHDSVLLEALIRKNAMSHLERPGVHPFHFQFLLAVTVKVFDECPASATAPRKGSVSTGTTTVTAAPSHVTSPSSAGGLDKSKKPSSIKSPPSKR